MFCMIVFVLGLVLQIWVWFCMWKELKYVFTCDKILSSQGDCASLISICVWGGGLYSNCLHYIYFHLHSYFFADWVTYGLFHHCTQNAQTNKTLHTHTHACMHAHVHICTACMHTWTRTRTPTLLHCQNHLTYLQDTCNVNKGCYWCGQNKNNAYCHLGLFSVDFEYRAFCFSHSVCVCVCVHACMCVCVRERGRTRTRKIILQGL